MNLIDYQYYPDRLIGVVQVGAVGASNFTAEHIQVTIDVTPVNAAYIMFLYLIRWVRGHY